MKSFMHVFVSSFFRIISLSFDLFSRTTKCCFLILLLAVVTCVQAQRTLDPEFEKMLDKLLSHKASEISVKDVSLLSDIVFIDVREKEEYEVSHIQNAIWAGYNDFRVERISHINPNSQVIIYCSVGYRSEKICLKLAKMGYDKSYNLFGGIFEWVNQGFSVYNEKGITTKVHAYSEKWGQWLTKGDKVFSEEG